MVTLFHDSDKNELGSSSPECAIPNMIWGMYIIISQLLSLPLEMLGNPINKRLDHLASCMDSQSTIIFCASYLMARHPRTR